ncbi:MAG: hypothetical protein KAI24_00680 [Planctomycetes bacterium]|nr:hypothetical protein [Planctomycetota bacterium]
MGTTITIEDRSTTGNTLREFRLELLSTTLSVRELIRERVYQEVEDHNRDHRFLGLVQPSEEEQARRDPADKRRIDWKAQYEVALRAFEANRVLVLVDDQQVDDLDAQVTVGPDTRVAFLKLTPLVGG